MANSLGDSISTLDHSSTVHSYLFLWTVTLWSDHVHKTGDTVLWHVCGSPVSACTINQMLAGSSGLCRHLGEVWDTSGLISCLYLHLSWLYKTIYSYDGEISVSGRKIKMIWPEFLLWGLIQPDPQMKHGSGKLSSHISRLFNHQHSHKPLFHIPSAEAAQYLLRAFWYRMPVIMKFWSKIFKMKIMKKEKINKSFLILCTGKY